MRTVWGSLAIGAATMLVLGAAAGNASAEGVFIDQFETNAECVAAGEQYRSSDTWPDCVYGQQGSGWQLWVRSAGG
ncbi:hypothetical protein [Nocardia suismassiliense]|uniref:hypothetical protein n=1 Tax=Nocardia suismassiliense TaxID=2077092 RepID=UPI00131F0119|nr:hypothetical protein [Nocardia suismassiliense]